MKKLCFDEVGITVLTAAKMTLVLLLTVLSQRCCFAA